MNEKTVQASANDEFENVNGSVNPNKDTYLDTNNLINRQKNELLKEGRRERKKLAALGFEASVNCSSFLKIPVSIFNFLNCLFI